MSENILKSLEDRNQFLGHLEKDIERSDLLVEDATREKQKIEQLIQDIRALAVYPEHEALIPLSKNIYMKGKIVHTGEYYIEKKAHPDSYVALQSLDSTMKSLENEVNSLESNIDKAEYAKFQLEERMKILKGVTNEQETHHDDLPKEIKSDKGVAVKVGDFYEILEFEPES